MWRTLMVSLLLVPSSDQASFSDQSENATFRCPIYVTEGESLKCDCLVRIHKVSVTWPGSSNNSTLTVSKVTRADNGTVFTCLMTLDGRKRTANYTLQVAYGPDDHHTRIHGPEILITDGTKYFNLTCKATDVHPRPKYTWDGVTCHNNDTDQGLCVLRPQPPWDDGRKVLCTARSNTTFGSVGKTTRRLNLTYPPPKPPEILGYKGGQVLRNGDILHCRVSGGKPLVKEVNFSCFSDPPHQDQQDTTNGSFMQSSLTIGAADSPNYIMLCVCGAIWETDEDLYSQNSSITVLVNNNDEATYFGDVKLGVTVALPAGLIIIVSIAVAVFVKMKKTQTGLARKTTESFQQNNRNGQARQISSPDYKEVDELAIQECNGGNIVENSSHRLSVSKNKAFSSENIACEMSESREIFHACPTGLDSEKRMKRFLTTRLGISPGKTTQLSTKADDGLYTEIDIHIQGESAIGNPINDITTAIAPINTCFSPRTRACDIQQGVEKVAHIQASISFSSLNKPDSQKEERKLYDTLRWGSYNTLNRH